MKIICKKINSLTFRISNLKLATLNEIKDANKESIIVGYKFNGASDVLKNIPIARAPRIIKLINIFDKKAFCSTGYKRTTTINTMARKIPTLNKY